MLVRFVTARALELLVDPGNDVVGALPADDTALEHAIITERTSIPASVRAALAPIAGRYL